MRRPVLEEARQRCSLGGDRGIMCGEAGCLQCGFTSATSHPLFETIINCSIIQMIFTRANYTGPTSCRENGLSVLLLHSQAEESAAEAVQEGVKPLALWLELFLHRECLHTGNVINDPL